MKNSIVLETFLNSIFVENKVFQIKNIYFLFSPPMFSYILCILLILCVSLYVRYFKKLFPKCMEKTKGRQFGENISKTLDSRGISPKIEIIEQ